MGQEFYHIVFARIRALLWMLVTGFRRLTYVWLPLGSYELSRLTLYHSWRKTPPLPPEEAPPAPG